MNCWVIVRTKAKQVAQVFTREKSFNPLKHEGHPKNIQNFIFYITLNTTCLHYKHSCVILLRIDFQVQQCSGIPKYSQYIHHPAVLRWLTLSILGGRPLYLLLSRRRHANVLSVSCNITITPILLSTRNLELHWTKVEWKQVKSSIKSQLACTFMALM